MMKGFLLLEDNSVLTMDSALKMASAQASRMFGWSNPHILEMVHSRYGYLVVASDDSPGMVGSGSNTHGRGAKRKDET